jgi:DNA-directed RNA polymerase specialized sigma24 family protein
MRGDLGSLYDAHAARLYAYCWSLVGDQLAAAAVGDTFAAAVHQPPRGDSVLWLYSLSRTACAERGAFGAMPGGLPFADPDPLVRAAGSLRADHREVLLLWAGEWLEIPDIARVLGLAPDTVGQLLNAARSRLERAVLDTLMRGTAGPQLELIAAFEKGRLPRLLAKRAPAQAPGWLREQVLAACEAEADRPLPSVAAPSPLVVIGDAGRKPRERRGVWSKGLGAAAGVAASAAAVIGLLVSWPTAKGGGAASLVPTAGSGRTDPASAKTTKVTDTPPPGLTGSERAAGRADPSGNPVTSAFDGRPTPAGGTPGRRTAPGSPATPGAPAGSPVQGSPSDGGDPGSGTPGKPGGTSPTTPPDSGTPTTPPDSGSPDPTTPPDDGSTGPATPPDTPSDPPATGTPGPSPTSNPTPEPGQS